MKISKISIKDFHQFKDLTIDLTYPKGHEKEGQPLDKVCFIGQSGTGKTTLLELILSMVWGIKTKIIHEVSNIKFGENILVDVLFGNNLEHSATVYKQDYRLEILDTSRLNSALSKNYKKQVEPGFLSKYANWITHSSSKPIYFPANLNFDISSANIEQVKKNDSVIDFSKQKVSFIWNLILEKIQLYQEQELKIRQEISKTVEQSSNDLETIKKALKKLEDWKSTEFNPIQDVADNCLNPLLKSFKLKVKTELDIKSKDDIGFIKIEDFDGNQIPNGLWSTGTKQVVLSALPLYLLKPKNTIILFDEPERSLYPDLQRTIVNYYATLAENCQLFYATHSPIIASSFDPWEIVELKFDEEGHVYRELYYEGENHVDNYKWNPKYMRWDDILQRIFDLENDGSDERRKKLDELAKQNVRYRKMEKNGNADSADGKNILNAIQQLSKELSYWED